MNNKQKIILIIGTILFVWCGLYPPTKETSSTLSLSHTFLFDGEYGNIEFVNLSIRWIIIAVLTSSLIYLFKTNKEKK